MSSKITKGLKSIFIPCFLIGALAGCGISTATYGTGETVEVGLARDLASLATFGTLGKKEQERISYRERGPLVVPNEEQIVSMPQPIGKVDDVDGNFPGRAAEIEREKRKEERKLTRAIINPFIDNGSSKAIGPKQQKNDKELNGADPADRGFNAQVGTAASIGPRELTKTPSEIAEGRGVSIDELPSALQGGVVRERSILERAGLVQPRQTRQSQSLTDLPVEYRTVQQDITDPSVNQAPDTEKKKKKRFLFF